MFGRDSSTTKPISPDDKLDSLLATMQKGIREGPGKEFVEDHCWLRLYKLLFELVNANPDVESLIAVRAAVREQLLLLNDLNRQSKEAEFAASRMKKIYHGSDSLIPK